MYKEDGYKLMGAAFEVYNEIGFGLSETIYQQSTEVELRLRTIPFIPKLELRVYYKGHELDAKYIPDFLIFDAIVAELTAVSALTPEHEAQLFNYMRIARIPVGYLVNFGRAGGLEWKRFIPTDFHERKH